MAGEQAAGGGFDWASLAGGLGGGLLGALGSYFGAQQSNMAAKDAALASEQAKAWTQLLGLSAMGKYTPDLVKALGQYKKTTSQLPGVAKRGTKAQLQQVQGAETSAISQIMKNQQAAMGGVGQNAASRGFYGSSVQNSQNNQVRANTNQSIGDLMAQLSGQRAGIVGQGTQNLMQALLAKASGQLTQGQGMYGIGQNRANYILQTGNAYGVDPNALNVQMSQLAPYQGMITPSNMAIFQHWAQQSPGQYGDWMKNIF